MSEVLWVTDKVDLEDAIEQGRRVVIDFTAPAWCVPCQRFAPHFDKAAEVSDDVTFVAVDVDKAPWAMADFGVQSVPTVMLYEDGKYKKTLLERTAVKILGEISS